MKVILCGQFKDASGYGNAARNYLAAFDKNNIRDKIEFYIFDLSFEATKGSFLTTFENELIHKYLIGDEKIQQLLNSKDYTLISFQVPHIPQQIKTNHSEHVYSKLLNNASNNVTMVVWETDKVPEMWKNILFKNIIVPCSWNYNVFSSQTQSNVFLLPYPITKNNIVQNKQKDTFNILSISQWTLRKGFDTLIKAFCAEFHNHDDVCLTIKTYKNEIFNVNKEQEKQSVIDDIRKYKSSVLHYGQSSTAKIKLITDVITKQQIEEIYSQADVFCLATRGEGFGLTIAEASSYGLPCIVPDKGGHIDFLDRENNLLYNSYYSTVLNCNGPYSSLNMKYVESDFDSLREKMRLSYNLWKQNKLQHMGVKSKLFIDNYLNDVNITNKFIEIIERINNE
jgi:glycosyltransferase involved in cell wall biosynthesis